MTETPPKLAKTKAHSIEAIVDRVAIREGIRPRLSESLDLALKLSGGGIVALLDSPSGWEEQLLSIHLNCPQCGSSLPAIDPRTFSFNSPHGACPACEGLGSRTTVPARPGRPRPHSLLGIRRCPALVAAGFRGKSFRARPSSRSRVPGSSWCERRHSGRVMAGAGLGCVLVGRARRRLSGTGSAARAYLRGVCRTRACENLWPSTRKMCPARPAGGRG